LFTIYFSHKKAQKAQMKARSDRPYQQLCFLRLFVAKIKS